MSVKPSHIFSLSLATLLCASCGKKQEPNTPAETNSEKEVVEAKGTEKALQNRRVAPQEMVETKDELPHHELHIESTQDPEEFLANFIELLGSEVSAEQIKEMLESHSSYELSAEQVAQISQLQSHLQHSDLNGKPQIEKVGDLQINKVSRWALKDGSSAPILIDVERQGKQHWSIKQIAIPQIAAPSNTAKTNNPDDAKAAAKSLEDDALNFSYFFLQSLLKQDFKGAKSMVDTNNITDATLAGLCILFDEAAYTIDKKKPLRTLFIRDTAAGFYANVLSSDGSKAAHFSILTQRTKLGDDWSIYEINLNDLLSDYTKRMAGGDSFFTPLVKNPQGGDTLVIYFDFDSAEITPRMNKQLKIVTALLQLDANKKITLSGHTDSKGLNQYNLSLSEQRAQKVKEFLSANGVDSKQIITKSLGATVPRAPNTYTDGTDNPDGRRANRRTEIYLDF